MLGAPGTENRTFIDVVATNFAVWDLPSFSFAVEVPAVLKRAEAKTRALATWSTQASGRPTVQE